ncbi:hypothetical protein ASC90_03100 [Rhizobium sp. Root1220]|nr:hypothetical protein ASC90_03100 [Rhizobium sp. Root1220]
MIEPAPPTAPLTDGLEATVAGGAGGGFEELWKTYFPNRGQGDKKKARAVYEKLAPDADLHAALLESAQSWFDAWAAQGKPDAPRKHLDTWLAGEHYECDPPSAYKAKERKAPAARALKPEPVNDNEPAAEEIPDFMKGSPSLWPEGEYWGEFVENEVLLEYDGKDTAVHLTFLVNTPGENFGKRLLHRFYAQSWMKSAQDEGNRYLVDICGAIGVPGCDELDELMFHPIRVKADGRTLTYTKIEEAAA